MNWGQRKRCNLNLTQTVLEKPDIPEFKSGPLAYRGISWILYIFSVIKMWKMNWLVQEMIATSMTSQKC